MKRTSLAAMLMVAVAACGGDPGNNQPPPDGGFPDLTGVPPGSDLTFVPPPTAAEACAQIQAVTERLIGDCFGYDRTWYASYSYADLICASQVASVAAGRQSYDAGALAACLDTIAHLSCSEYFMGGLSRCKAFQPAVAGTGSCHHFADCVEGYCPVFEVSCPRTCVQYLSVGASCMSGDPCTPGSTCQGGKCVSPAYAPVGGSCANQSCDFFTGYCDTATHLCVPKRTSGSCTGVECAYGYQCAGATGSRSCQASKHLGAACTPNHNECAASEAYCSTQSNTCALRTTGESCGYIDGMTNEYALCLSSATWCQLPMGQQVGTCQPHVGEGAPCTSAECGTGTLCVMGACRPLVCP